MINIEDLAKAFLEQMNEWHTYSEPYDDDLDAWLHERETVECVSAELAGRKKN